MTKRSSAAAFSLSSSSSSSSSSSGFFLLKSEPAEFSIQHLQSSPEQTTTWSGIRNHVAKKHLASAKVGDAFLFYHSSDGKNTGVVGTGLVCRESYPDPTQFDPSSPYFDSKITSSTPIDKQWKCIDVKFETLFGQPVLLTELKARRDSGNTMIANMALFKLSRLSVQPVTSEEYTEILRLADELASAGPPATKTAKKAKK